MMYNKFNGKTFSYVIKEDAVNPDTSKNYSPPINIFINNIKDNDELEIATEIVE